MFLFSPNNHVEGVFGVGEKENVLYIAKLAFKKSKTPLKSDF